jgi:hypothetical protein
MTSAKAIRYDVIERVGGEPAFELVSDEEMAHFHDQRGVARDTDNTGDDKAVEVEVAHAVSAATAAELVGLPPSWVERLERHIAEFGSFGVGSLTENWEVRRTRDN